MRGSDDDPGMMILCIRDIFDYIESHKNSKYKLRVSYMEVYNEEINDLLGVGNVIVCFNSIRNKLYLTIELIMALFFNKW